MGMGSRANARTRQVQAVDVGGAARGRDGQQAAAGGERDVLDDRRREPARQAHQVRGAPRPVQAAGVRASRRDLCSPVHNPFMACLRE